MDKKLKLSNRWKIFFLIEIVLLIISLIMPITPSKTGSTTKLTDWFFKNPSYFEEVLFYLIFINLIVIILADIFFIWLRVTKKAAH
jgi:hypothetical protein